MKIRISNEMIKKAVISSLTFSIVIGNTIGAFANNYDDMVLTINGGHSRQSGGALGVNGLKEEELARKVKEEVIYYITSKVDAEVSSYSNDLEMQGENKYIDMNNRLKYAYEQLADLNIDFHFNSGGSEGFEIMVNGNMPKHIKQACENFAREYCNKTGIGLRRGKGLYTAEGFKMVSFQNDTPSIIMELAYIDNAKDIEGKYDTDENIKKTAKIIGDGIITNFIQNPKLQKDQLGETDKAYKKGAYTNIDGEDHSKDDAHQRDKVQITKYNPFKSNMAKKLDIIMNSETPDADLQLFEETTLKDTVRTVLHIEPKENELQMALANFEVNTDNNQFEEITIKENVTVAQEPNKEVESTKDKETVKEEVEFKPKPLELEPQPTPTLEDIKEPLFTIKDGEVTENEDVKQQIEDAIATEKEEIQVKENTLNIGSSVVVETKPIMEEAKTAIDLAKEKVTTIIQDVTTKKENTNELQDIINQTGGELNEDNNN